METEYGQWSEFTKIHIVGYDGKWLCGRNGKTSTECSHNLNDASCKMCLKKLPDYLKKFAIPSYLIKHLKESLSYAESMANKADGKDASCSVENLNHEASLYIRTWIIPAIRDMINHFEEE